jgi:hypothetical protein
MVVSFSPVMSRRQGGREVKEAGIECLLVLDDPDAGECATENTSPPGRIWKTWRECTGRP